MADDVAPRAPAREIPGLRAFRERHGLSQAACARLLGLTQQAVAKAEAEGREPSRPAVLLMALADEDPAIMARLRALSASRTGPDAPAAGPAAPAPRA